MQLLPLALGLLAAALPLRAQNIFVVTEGGGSFPVKAVANHHPVVSDKGHLRRSDGLSFSLRKATIFGPGVLDTRIFKAEITTQYSNGGSPQFHVWGHLTADVPLKNVFFVMVVNGDLGNSIFFDALPDLVPGQKADYDQLFDLPIREVESGRYTMHYFANGLEELTTAMPPFYVTQQHEKTRMVLERAPAPR